MALLYVAKDDAIERVGSGGAISIPEATIALDRWRKRARSMDRDGLAHGAGLSAAIADELAEAIRCAKRVQETPMKPNLTLVTAEPSQTLKAAEASRRAHAQSAEHARTALEIFIRSLKQLSSEAASLADLPALPSGPRERARRMAMVLEAEGVGFAHLQAAANRAQTRPEI